MEVMELRGMLGIEVREIISCSLRAQTMLSFCYSDASSIAEDVHGDPLSLQYPSAHVNLRSPSDPLSEVSCRSSDWWITVAILFRYRFPMARSRPPHGLKVIRKLNAALDKENYPVDESRFAKIFRAVFRLKIDLRG